MSKSSVQQRENNFYLTLFDEFPALIWQSGLDAQCNYFNKTWLHFRGRTFEEESGNGWLEGVYPDDREVCIKTYMDAFHLRKRFEMEYRLRHHSGEYRWIIDIGRPFHNSHGDFTGYIGTCFDISERKRSEEILRRSENRFKELSDLLPQTIFEIDTTGKMEYVNREAYSMFGYSVEDFSRGLNALQMLIPDDRDRALKEIKKILNGGQSDGNEYTALRKDGTTFPIMIYSHLIIHDNAVQGLRGIIVDISHQKQTEEKLRLQSTALQIAANAIVMTDADGKLMWANDAFTLLTGYAVNEVVGKKMNVLSSGKHPAEFYQNLWETILSGKVWRNEVVNKRKDGTLYTEDMTITPVPDEYGKLTHFIAIKQDITEQKQLREQLFQAQKMESLGTLAGGIAHDFNNLLGIILVYSNLMEESPNNHEIYSEALAAINRAVMRGKDITGQILTFAHKTELKFERIDIDELLLEFIEMATKTFPKTISFSHALNSIPPLYADRTQLHQVVLNLCLNAKDSMGDAGIITVSTDIIAGDVLLKRFVEAKENAYVRISINDTGAGMDEYTIKRIWEPFFSTKEKTKGTGLGLAVVYGIIKTHRGFIHVESAAGKGTTFEIYLPLSAINEEKLLARTGMKITLAAHEGTETILFIEDEELLTRQMKTYFEKRGYSVLTAKDGQEAIDIYDQHKRDINIIITDIGLPKISGIELFKHFKKINPDVKIILASGFFDPESMSQLTGAGANALIYKPYVPSEILSVVRDVLDSL